MVDSLFDHAGGREGVRRIVDTFYGHVEADPVLRPVYPDDLEPGKEKLALFFEQWLGGEPVYSERFGHPRLRRRHFPFVIGQVHAGRWLRHMQAAMRECGLADADVRAIFARLGPLAHHMINEGEEVPREPLANPYLQ